MTYSSETPSLIHQLRTRLQPRGTAPIVGLRTSGSGMWLSTEFVQACIDELEHMGPRAAVGDAPNNLEKLAYLLLCDSAELDTSHYLVDQ